MKITKKYLKPRNAKVVNEDLEIICAHELSLDAMNAIKEKFGNSVNVKVTLDPSILGGVIVRKGSQYFDSSIKTQLSELKQKLIQ